MTTQATVKVVDKQTSVAVAEATFIMQWDPILSTVIAEIETAIPKESNGAKGCSTLGWSVRNGQSVCGYGVRLWANQT